MCAGLSSTARIAKGVGAGTGGIVWSPQREVSDQTMCAIERDEEENTDAPRCRDGSSMVMVHPRSSMTNRHPHAHTPLATAPLGLGLLRHP